MTLKILKFRIGLSQLKKELQGLNSSRGPGNTLKIDLTINYIKRRLLLLNPPCSSIPYIKRRATPLGVGLD